MPCHAGAEHWSTIASLIETAKLNNVEPLAYLSEILTRIVNGHPNTRIDDLLPWAYAVKPELADIVQACFAMPRDVLWRIAAV